MEFCGPSRLVASPVLFLPANHRIIFDPTSLRHPLFPILFVSPLTREWRCEIFLYQDERDRALFLHLNKVRVNESSYIFTCIFLKDAVLRCSYYGRRKICATIKRNIASSRHKYVNRDSRARCIFLPCS